MLSLIRVGAPPDHSLALLELGPNATCMQGLSSCRSTAAGRDQGQNGLAASTFTQTTNITLDAGFEKREKRDGCFEAGSQILSKNL
jgi:hypothetical protein